MSDPREQPRISAEEIRISPEEYRRIESQIASDDSPVGIDAKKTHVLILHRLDELARRLERIERGLEDRTA